MPENTNLITKDIEEVLSDSFLTFAGYNIQRRAIPDVRDGLKWGARQLLHAQNLGGFTYNKPFKKATKSVSQAMGFSYVHGDASAYGTFIRMGKPFSYRYPLQEVNGNFGTLINPDDHSASRYVELRGSKIAALLLKDLDKDTITEWEDTYDLEGKFPRVLPSKGFWAGVNGCISIGSGMACSIPPTNLKEVNEAFIKLLKNPNIDVDELICMPDFPTGAILLNADEVRESLKKGNGSACKVRAVIEFDKSNNCFIVKEMPYSTFINTICHELAVIMEENPNCGIKDFADYTKRQPDLRIYLEKGSSPDKVLKLLYKETSLQTYFSINMICLDKGISPKLFGWKEMLQAHIDHEKEVYRRGFEFDLRKIKDRIHVIDGLLICLARIEEVVQTIKTSTSTAIASTELQKKFLLDDAQAKAVLDMKLSRLAHLEIKKLESEKKELEAEAKKIEEILNNAELFNNELIKGWQEVAEKFGDARRTKIMNLSSNDEEVIEKKQLQISLTNKDALFAIESSTLYTQRRGGVGNKFKLDKDEYIVSSIVVDNTDELLFFTESGDVYHCKASTIELNQKSYISAYITLSTTSRICALASSNGSKKYIVFVTKDGVLKKSELNEYNTKRNTGVKALNLSTGDHIISALLCDDEPIGILTKSGNFLITETSDVRPLGRVATGIHGIKLNAGDEVISAHLIPKSTTEIISISKNGLFKRTAYNEFTTQGKNTKGSKIQKLNENDWMADYIPISQKVDLIIGSSLSTIKLTSNDVPLQSKLTVGIKSIKLDKIGEVLKILICE